MIVVPGAALVDGETFTIADGFGEAQTFEFDKDNASVLAPIPIAAGDTAAMVATRIAAAVNASSLQVTAFTTGAAVWLTNDNTGSAGNLPILETVASSDFAVSGMSGGTDVVTEAEPSAAIGVIVVVPGAALVDGDTFTIADGAGGTQTFEFDKNNAAVFTPIPITIQDTAGMVATRIAMAVNDSPLQVTAYATAGASVWLANDTIGSAGNLPILENVASVDFVVRGMSGGVDGATEDGSSAATGVMIVVPGASLVDGETFTIVDGFGGAQTFEFDMDTVAAFTRIPITAVDTAAMVATRIAAAVNASSLQVTATKTGAAVWLTNDRRGSAGNVPIQETVVSSNFVVKGMSGGTDVYSEPEASAATGVMIVVPGVALADGGTFTIADGVGGARTFEFDHDNAAVFTPIPITTQYTAEMVATRIAIAVNASSLKVTATAEGAAVWLANDTIGSAGNQSILEDVAAADFVVVGMSGGVDPADDDPPTDAPIVSGVLGSSEWYTSSVSVNWNWSDAGSGLDSSNCEQTSITTGEGAAIVLSSSCRDLAGNGATDSTTVKIDMSAPIVMVTNVTEGAQYLLGQAPQPGCSTIDAVSDVEISAMLSMAGGPTGPVTATCSGAIDHAGNAAGSVSVTYSVVAPNPPPSSVSGRGWFDSPRGAFVSDPNRLGKATFAVSSRLKKGATVPSGNVEFTFPAAGIAFQSGSFALVPTLNTNSAQLQGVGTLNGVPGFDFVLWASEGAPGRVRIRITHHSAAVIYDNGTEQAISGGSITIR